MSVDADQIDTLRDLFLKKLEKEGAPCGTFHPADLERVKTNNHYVGLYLEHNDLDMKLSLQMLWDVCTWRKNFGVNEITESNIRMDYVNHGVVFPHNKDKDGKTLLIFKCKLHAKGTKDMTEMMRVVVYWIERVFAENNLEKMTVFFDMQGCSVGNVDMDFIKKIIETLKLYPLPLNYIIIYELPWILNAAFKIIKGLLPPKAVAIMKFLSQKNVSEFVDIENCLTSWGGKDDYTFCFKPGTQAKKPSSHAEVTENNNETDFEPFKRQKVHFANPPSPTRKQMSDPEENVTPTAEEMLRITPGDVIILNKTDTSSEGELTGTVDITSTSKTPITYKIKTTSPLKFRVRPSSGALCPGATVSINVILQPGRQVSTASKDKFLVMCTQLPEGVDANNSQFIAEFWKALPSNSPNVQQHRLQCITVQNAQGDQMRNGHMHSSGTYTDDYGDRKNNNLEATQVSETLKRLEQQMRLSVNLHWLSLLVFIILSIAFTYIIKQEIQEQNPDTCSKSSGFY